MRRKRSFAKDERYHLCHSTTHDVDQSLFGKDWHMTMTVKCSVAILALLCAMSSSYAGPCANSIARVQAQVDGVIEKRAGADGWKPESLAATRNYQPTPRSLAATEGYNGQDLEIALDSLDRARAADIVGNTAVCRRELAYARTILRAQRQ
jgi:hypothetical protein